MKISERIIRIILGAIFIISGLLKIQDPLLFYGDILSFGIIAGQPALLAAYFIPWLEVVCGAALVFRWRYSSTLILYFSLIVVFSLLLLSALLRGVELNCGCFGAGEATNIPLALGRNGLLLAGLAFLGWQERLRTIQVEAIRVEAVQREQQGNEPQETPQKKLLKRHLFLTIAGIMGLALVVLIANANQPLLRNGFIYAAITDSIIEHGFTSEGPIITEEIRSFSKPVGFSFLAVPFALLFGLNVGMKVTSFCGGLFFLWMAVIFFKRMNSRLGIHQQWLPLELGLLFCNPLILYQFWSGYPDSLFAGQVLLAFLLTDNIVSGQKNNQVISISIIGLGMVIVLAILTKLYGLILGIACPVYLLLHWRSFWPLSEKRVKIAWLLGVFALLGLFVILALLGHNSLLSYGSGSGQAENYTGYNEFSRGLDNPQQEFSAAFTALLVMLVLNFHFALFFLFGRGSKPLPSKAVLCFVGVFLVFLLPFGSEVLYNIRFFIPILAFMVLTIVRGVNNLQQTTWRKGLFWLYGGTATLLALNYNLEKVHTALPFLNATLEASVFGEQEVFDNLRMSRHLHLGKQRALLNQVIEPNGELYWLSSYYETSTHRVIKQLGIRPDINVHCLLYPTALPEKTLYIASYYKSFSSWREQLGQRFAITFLGSDLWRLEPLIKISSPLQDTSFQPDQAMPLGATLGGALKSQQPPVVFMLDGHIIALDNLLPYSTSWPAVGIGRHRVQASISTEQGELLSAPVSIFVGLQAMERSIVEYDDDGEELADGTMYLTSSDLELTQDPEMSPDPQIVGLRFTDIQIPQGAVVKKAFIQFTVSEVSEAGTDVTLHAEKVAHAAKIITERYDLSQRAITKNVVRWTPEPWTVQGEQSRGQQTPDLSALIREVIEQSGWQPGNAILFLLRGRGQRIAQSVDGAEDYRDVPRLYIEYSTDD